MRVKNTMIQMGISTGALRRSDDGWVISIFSGGLPEEGFDSYADLPVLVHRHVALFDKALHTQMETSIAGSFVEAMETLNCVLEEGNDD